MKRLRIIRAVLGLAVCMCVLGCGRWDGGGDGPGQGMTMTREEAFQIVMREVVDQLDEEVRDTTSVYAPLTFWIKETDFRPAFRETDEETGEPINPLEVKVLDKPAWFFFVDLNFIPRFGHPTIYVWVYNDGSFETLEQEWWPLINGQAWFDGAETMNATDLRMYPAFNPYDYIEEELELAEVIWNGNPVVNQETVAAGNASFVPSDTEDPCCEGTGAWIVNGGGQDASVFKMDTDRMKEFLTDTLGVNSDDITEFEASDSDDESDRWREKAREIAQKTRERGECYCDYIFYYSGHGAAGGFATAGDGHQVSSRKPAALSSDAENTGTVRPSHLFGRKATPPKRPKPTKGILGELCAKRIYVIADSCYSGSLINHILRDGSGLCCDQLTVITATSRTKQSGSSLYSGGYYTSAFLEAISDMDDPPYNDLGELFGDAHYTAANSTLTVWNLWAGCRWNLKEKQNPQKMVFEISEKADDCCDCCHLNDPVPANPPTIGAVPTEFSFSHVIDESPCPQQIGNFAITNTGGGNLQFIIGNIPAWLTVMPPTGMAPNNVQLWYNCDGNAPGARQAQLTIVGFDPTDGTQASNNPVLIDVNGNISQQQPTIHLSPTELHFTHEIGVSPCPQLIGTCTITNTGTGSLSWDILSILPEWLSVVPIGGIAPTTVQLFYNCTSDNPGTVNTLLEVTGEETTSHFPASNSPEHLYVEGNLVQAVPTILADPNSLNFTHTISVSPCPQVIGSMQIINTGTGSLSWNITGAVPPWLNVTPMSGTAPSTVQFSFTCNVGGPGAVSAQLNLNGWETDSSVPASNTPVPISVTGDVVTP